MVLMKEYRICMPLTVKEYHVGLLYTVARHSLEQSTNGINVEVIENRECTDPKHGTGQYTEKRIYFASKLPEWVQALFPNVYMTEKSWNYYPYTITEATCSMIKKFDIRIETRYEDNNGSSENCLGLNEEQLSQRIVEYIDIATCDLSSKLYKKEEDPKIFQSTNTNRGPLRENWSHNSNPVMCCYKLVVVNLDIWGLQDKGEKLVHNKLREVLVLGHRQAFTWIDDWILMSLAEVREYEQRLQVETNILYGAASSDDAQPSTEDIHTEEEKN